MWQASDAQARDEGKWWEAADTVALDLSHNDIRSIPAEITDISETLEILNIWCVRCFPSSSRAHATSSQSNDDTPLAPRSSCGPLACIPGLTIWRKLPGAAVLLMSCSHNPLRELPGHLGALQQLKVLDVSSTGLAGLPEELAALQHLVKLFCQGNALGALPASLGLHQQKLQHVSLLHFTCPECASCASV